MTISSSLVSNYKTFVKGTFNESWKEAYDILNGELKHHFPGVSYDFVRREDLEWGGIKVKPIPSPIPDYSEFRYACLFGTILDCPANYSGITEVLRILKDRDSRKRYTLTTSSRGLQKLLPGRYLEYNNGYFMRYKLGILCECTDVEVPRNVKATRMLREYVKEKMNGLMYVDSGSPMIHDNRLFGPLPTTMMGDYFGRFGEHDIGLSGRNLVLRDNSPWPLLGEQGSVVFKLRELDMRKNVLFMEGIYFTPTPLGYIVWNLREKKRRKVEELYSLE